MPNRPHILLITADELRMDSLGCYGQQAIRTPHIDSIAACGTRFDNAYTVSPLSLPSRCSMLTGLFPHNSRAYSNFRQCPLNPQLPNLYNQLRAGGYSTAHFGKCHYTPVPPGARPDATQDLENVKGFYMSLGLDHLDLENGKNNSVQFWNDYSRELEKTGCLPEYRRLAWLKVGNGRIFPFPGPIEWHPTAWTGRKASEYIQSHKGDQPRFAWVSFSGPHYPFDAPQEYYSRVDMSKIAPGHYRQGEFDQVKIQARAYLGGAERIGLAEGKNSAPGIACRNFDDAYWRRLRQVYLAEVAMIDDQVGRILSAARESWGDNIMVIFTTDHGEMLGNHRLWGKNSCGYDDVIRVPLVVHFPGLPARTSVARVMNIDLFPTCLSLAGLPLPERVDGRDLRQSIADGGYPYAISENDGMSIITDGQSKYIHWTANGEVIREAYDLSNDPHEFDNVIDSPEHAPAIAALQSALIARYMQDLLK